MRSERNWKRGTRRSGSLKTRISRPRAGAWNTSMNRMIVSFTKKKEFRFKGFPSYRTSTRQTLPIHHAHPRRHTGTPPWHPLAGIIGFPPPRRARGSHNNRTRSAPTPSRARYPSPPAAHLGTPAFVLRPCQPGFLPQRHRRGQCLLAQPYRTGRLFRVFFRRQRRRRRRRRRLEANRKLGELAVRVRVPGRRP